MNEITINERTYSIEQVKDLLFYLHAYYKQGMSIGCAYNDIALTINNGDYKDPMSALKVLDGAKESRDAELAHLNDRIFVKLRDFFEYMPT